MRTEPATPHLTDRGRLEAAAVRLLHDGYSPSQVRDRTGLPTERLQQLLAEQPSRRARPAPPPAGSPAREVDDVAVLRACDGDTSIRLTIAERREAVRALHRRGMSDGAIATRLSITARTVLRIRQELDLPAVDVA